MMTMDVSLFRFVSKGVNGLFIYYVEGQKVNVFRYKTAFGRSEYSRRRQKGEKKV